MNDHTNRTAARAEFLKRAGWGDAIAHPLAGDASTRRYERLTRGDAQAVLMIAPPGAEEPACPPDASPAARRALGYNALARLAGPNLNAFTALARTLRGAGLSAPDIYADDPHAGFVLIEDLGDDLFARVATQQNQDALYRAAMDALIALRAAAPERPHTDSYVLMEYDEAALAAEAALLADWYWPFRKGAPMADELKTELARLWAALLARLEPPHCLVLRDYHAENLLWLPKRQGVKRVGVIDFQDALYGSPAYDVVSLLEDARRDVAPAFAEAMRGYYVERAADLGGFSAEIFERDYAILAAQRNAKILGIFARLANRDGKTHYLDFIPRVEGLFRRDLDRPGLEDLKAFFVRHLKDLAP